MENLTKASKTLHHWPTVLQDQDIFFFLLANRRLPHWKTVDGKVSDYFLEKFKAMCDTIARPSSSNNVIFGFSAYHICLSYHIP